MPIPQVTERIKEAPAVALRAVFAGIGQLLLAVDKVRGRAQEQFAPPGQREHPAPPQPATGAGEQQVAVIPEEEAPATPAQPPAQPAPAGGPAPTEPAPSAPAPSAPAPAGPTPTGTAAPEQAPAGAAPGEAPIPGYDDLTVASLRARLRVLDPPALRALISYEHAHADRENVIAMFERRLAKITAQSG